jgi:hypothetical protein
LQRPSLEYHHAFDLCAVELHRVGGPLAVFAGSPFYARELLKRLPACGGMLFALGGWASPAADLVSLLGPELAATPFRLAAGADDLTRVPAAVWAEPESEGGEQVLAQIQEILLPAGHLYVVSSGWLARYLPEWQRPGDQPAVRPAGWRPLARWLRRGGFVVRALYGFHPPASVMWGYAFRLQHLLGRPELADRCHLRMRAVYVACGHRALGQAVAAATPVRVVVASRGAH